MAKAFHTTPLPRHRVWHFVSKFLERLMRHTRSDAPPKKKKKKKNWKFIFDLFVRVTLDGE